MHEVRYSPTLSLIDYFWEGKGLLGLYFLQKFISFNNVFERRL